ncbi:MAG: hypothetical protein GVY30_10685 [Chloroflexi bacterium]|jgi:hypothetical protein|nr:hypothetical protein [Chloroflexota bacterium]
MPQEFDVERIFKGELEDTELQAYYSELQNSNEKLVFNGINGATGEYSVPPMTADELATVILQEPKPENLGELKQKRAPGAFPIKPPNDPTKLSDAGWAVIFPAKDSDPAVKEALAELLNLRQAQAGERFKIYEGGAGYRPGETKAEFFKRHKIGGGPADPEQMPYYVLIVGSPEQIPYEFQYQLDVMRGVGRIHFDSVDAYAKYARAVVMAEKGEVKLPRRASFFGAMSAGDKATELSSKYLVRPLYRKLSKQPPFVRWVDGEDGGDTKRKVELAWEFESHLAERATKAKLSTLLGGDATPALLFTASHGMEFPLGDARQIPHQGALLCSDWPGPNQWRGQIPQDFYFATEDLGSNANLLGLLAFFFACFGGGSPRLDQFARHSQKMDREEIAPRNFLGELPQRLLGRGALAVVGHVERAWGYSFLSPGMVAQTGVFEGMLLQLLSGDPIGWATENLNMRYADLATELTNVLDEREWDPDFINPYDLAQMWTMHHDARNYVVIGDPAARIPMAMPDESPTARPDLGTITASAAPAPSAPKASPAEVEAPVSGEPYAAEAFGIREQVDDLTVSLREFTDQLAESLKEAAKDISTLEVKTYTTDDLTAVTTQSEGGARLRALTHIGFDGDMKVFVPEDREGEVDRALWEVHLEMVREAQVNRAQFLQAMAEMATNLLKSLK